MDENINQPAAKSSMNKMLIPAVVIGLLVIAAVAFYVMNQNRPDTTSSTVSPQGGQMTPGAETSELGESGDPGQPATTEAETASAYEDGNYEAEGTYVTPGGSRNVDVTVTLADGVITDATFVGNATDPNSRRFQGEFRENFTPLVVGKNIDEVELTKVAGSSLSPKGFMDALEKIKTEAQS